MKTRTFPDNPFLPVFAKIAMIDLAVTVVTGVLAYMFQDVWAYIVGGGVVLAVAVFVLLNQQVIRALQCPHCHQPIAFQKGEGLVCEKCKTIWELG